MAVLVLNIGIKWRVVSLAPRSLYLQGKDPRCQLNRRMSGSQCRSERFKGGEKKKKYIYIYTPCPCRVFEHRITQLGRCTEHDLPAHSSYQINMIIKRNNSLYGTTIVHHLPDAYSFIRMIEQRKNTTTRGNFLTT